MSFPILKSKKLVDLLKTGSIQKHLPVKFVIFSMPRSGSNFLCGTLNTHPEILCHHEVFHPQTIYYSLDHRNGDIDLGDIEQRDRWPKRFINKLWQHDFGCSAVGFKILKGQSPEASKIVIRDRTIKKILLPRRNIIKSYVSLEIAKQTGVYSNLQNPKNHEHQKNLVKVDLEKLDLWKEETENHYLFLRTQLKNQNYLEIAYEDLFNPSTSEATRSRLLKFLEVSPDLNLLQETHKKQNSSNLADLVANFTELEQKLRGTNLEPLLYSSD